MLTFNELKNFNYILVSLLVVFHDLFVMILTNMVLYMISFFQLPKGVLSKLDYFRSRFFWQGDGEKKKYRLAKWDVVCRPKDQGGLGIHDLGIKNSALLGRWVFKLLTEDGLRQMLLRRKYIGSKAVSQVY